MQVFFMMQKYVLTIYYMQGYPDFKLHDKIIPLPNIDKDGWVKITASGKCYAFNTGYNSKTEGPFADYETVAPQSVTILLQKNTPIENVKRIIKAMKHAAELEGAKLINDDLFKN